MHHADSGIQQHSIGDLYPWTIAGRGCRPVRWQAVNLITRVRGPVRREYETAEGDAKAAKENGR